MVTDDLMKRQRDTRSRRTWWILAVVLAVLAAGVFAARLGAWRDRQATSAQDGTAVTGTPPSSATPSGPVASCAAPPGTAPSGPQQDGACRAPQDLPVVSARSAPPGTTGRIDRPASGSTVRQCEVMAGTVMRPPGKDVFTAMRNLDNRERLWYVEDLFSQPAHGTIQPWAGAQYFGQADSTVGQHYEIVLFLFDKDTPVPDVLNEASVALLDQTGNRLASAAYERVAGVSDDKCAAP